MKRLIILPVIFSFLAACGGNEDESDDALVGFLGNVGFYGISYRTASQSGITNKLEKFESKNKPSQQSITLETEFQNLSKNTAIRTVPHTNTLRLYTATHKRLDKD